MALDDLQPDRINLNADFDFKGAVKKNGVNLANVNDASKALSQIKCLK